MIAAMLKGWKQRENSRTLLRSIPSGWRNNFYQSQQEIFIFNDCEYTLKYRNQKGKFSCNIENIEYSAMLISYDDEQLVIEIESIRYAYHIATKENQIHTHNQQHGTISFQKKERFPSPQTVLIKGGYETPMPSQIIQILVKEGQKVKAGEGLVILSSMKMENTIEATENGIIEEIYATAGQNVEAGFLLLKVKEEES